MCVLMVERSFSCIASLVIGILTCVHMDWCYCLLLHLALSMVVQFGIEIRTRLYRGVDAIILDRAKKILGYTLKTCNEAVRSLDSLSIRCGVDDIFEVLLLDKVMVLPVRVLMKICILYIV